MALLWVIHEVWTLFMYWNLPRLRLIETVEEEQRAADIGAATPTVVNSNRRVMSAPDLPQMTAPHIGDISSDYSVNNDDDAQRPLSPYGSRGSPASSQTSSRRASSRLLEASHDLVSQRRSNVIMEEAERYMGLTPGGGSIFSECVPPGGFQGQQADADTTAQTQTAGSIPNDVFSSSRRNQSVPNYDIVTPGPTGPTNRRQLSYSLPSPYTATADNTAVATGQANYGAIERPSVLADSYSDIDNMETSASYGRQSSGLNTPHSVDGDSVSVTSIRKKLTWKFFKEG